mmetsp:Transcript_25093/g.38917  ORF Transcript_25093/g.38917 Transcript_25093/m.38917 type:complete len:204 (-) Transcript_25093:41-652(-)
MFVFGCGWVLLGWRLNHHHWIDWIVVVAFAVLPRDAFWLVECRLRRVPVGIVVVDVFAAGAFFASFSCHCHYHYYCHRVDSEVQPMVYPLLRSCCYYRCFRFVWFDLHHFPSAHYHHHHHQQYLSSHSLQQLAAEVPHYHRHRHPQFRNHQPPLLLPLQLDVDPLLHEILPLLLWAPLHYLNHHLLLLRSPQRALPLLLDDLP